MTAAPALWYSRGMSRGTNADTKVAYQGPLGETRREPMHVSLSSGEVVTAELITSINSRTDAPLGHRLMSKAALNTVVDSDGSTLVVEVPVVYHDPVNAIFVLVVPDGDRTSELKLRAKLFERLAAATSFPVPDYVKAFDVVFGQRRLAAYLDARMDARLATAREHEREREQAAEAEALAEERERLVDVALAQKERAEALEFEAQRIAGLAVGDRTHAPLAAQPPDAGERKLVADAAAEVITSARMPRQDATVPEPLADDDRFDGASLPTSSPERPSVGAGNEPVVGASGGGSESFAAFELRPHAGQSQHGDSTAVDGRIDPVLHAWVGTKEPLLKTLDDAGVVRIGVAADAALCEKLLDSELDLRFRLARLPTAAVVALCIGDTRCLDDEDMPASLDGDSTPPRVTILFDLADAGDRAVLDALGKEFVFLFDLTRSGGMPVARWVVTAELAANVAYVLAMADEYESSLGRGRRDFARALLAYDAPTWDRVGASHPERREFRADKLSELNTQMMTRRALSIARRFSRPSREEYLVMVRGFPLARFQGLRKSVLERAVALGLWMGSDLASVAVSEGLARSRKDLVRSLLGNFARALEDVAVCDLDSDAIDDNWTALEGEARALGLSVDDRSVVDPAAPVGPGTSANRKDGVRLLQELEGRATRVAAALELAKRADAGTIGPVFAAIERMNRTEAVRALGASVAFGTAVIPALVMALDSRKAFVRQGAALALACLHDEDAIDRVVDALFAEPTEIWKELARALGIFGHGAVAKLAAALREHGGDATAAERAAWALAHIGARGATSHLEALAKSRDALAAQVARRALELEGPARRDELPIAGQAPARDQTVNRAFSMKFFQALDRLRDAMPNTVEHDLGADLSGPAMLLDEADLLDAADLSDLEDDADELDDADLMPS